MAIFGEIRVKQATDGVIVEHADDERKFANRLPDERRGFDIPDEQDAVRNHVAAIIASWFSQ